MLYAVIQWIYQKEIKYVEEHHKTGRKYEMGFDCSAFGASPSYYHHCLAFRSLVTYGKLVSHLGTGGFGNKPNPFFVKSISLQFPQAFQNSFAGRQKLVKHLSNFSSIRFIIQTTQHGNRAALIQ